MQPTASGGGGTVGLSTKLMIAAMRARRDPGASPAPITPEWLEAWAATYPVDADAVVLGLADKARPTYADVEAIVRWKSTRSIGYFGRNRRSDVLASVRGAIDVDDELDALRRLVALHGVRERVGSAILAVLRPSRYTVMDVRAWTTLIRFGYLDEHATEPWLASWVPYLDVCRGIASESALDLRTVDRALWAANGSLDPPRSSG
jgi:hypothetical protein